MRVFRREAADGSERQSLALRGECLAPRSRLRDGGLELGKVPAARAWHRLTADIGAAQLVAARVQLRVDECELSSQLGNPALDRLLLRCR